MSDQIEGNVILVVDDDEINLQMAKMILEKKLPCRVIMCDNGVQGIEILKRQYVKLLLLDIMMPFFDGMQTLEKIREDSKLKNLPVIMLTASADVSHIKRAIELGVTDYVKKPFMPDELIGRVSKHLGPITNNSKQIALLIDDDDQNRKRMTFLLEDNLPYEILVAPSGIEGMEILRREKINLVVASADMRFINGYRIADFMSKDQNLNNIPLFIITSNDDEDTQRKIKSCGAKGYLKKPATTVEDLKSLMSYLKEKK